jgi:hypothetical protein
MPREDIRGEERKGRHLSGQLPGILVRDLLLECRALFFGCAARACNTKSASGSCGYAVSRDSVERGSQLPGSSTFSGPPRSRLRLSRQRFGSVCRNCLRHSHYSSPRMVEWKSIVRGGVVSVLATSSRGKRYPAPNHSSTAANGSKVVLFCSGRRTTGVGAVASFGRWR